MAGSPNSLRSILYAFWANFLIFRARGYAALLGLMLALGAVKAEMAPTRPESQMIVAVNRVEAGLGTPLPQTAWLFFEPDATDGD